MFFFLWVSPSVSGYHETPSPPSTSEWVPHDSSAWRISGTYATTSDPKGRVNIHPIPGGITYVKFENMWESVGFFDGKAYEGMVRGIGASGLLRSKASLGTLHFTLLPDLRIQALLKFPGDREARNTETWTRADIPGSATPSPPSRIDDPDLPPFGAYVSVDELPEAIQKVEPHYPEEARKKGIQGTVIVQALIGKDGTVRDTKIANSIPELDRAATACVRLWRFKPALAQSKPVAIWVAVPVRFVLR